MSKTRKSSTRKRPTENVAIPGSSVLLASSDAPASKENSFTSLMESVTQPILTVTYWFEPESRSEPYSMTVRFSGRRIDAKGRIHQKDKFIQDETIERVVPGSGPISVTARVHNIHPGEWSVTANILNSTFSTTKAREQRNAENTNKKETSASPLAQFWHRKVHTVDADTPVHTCLTPFARVPGILPGIWAIMVVSGMIVALFFQWLVVSRTHLAFGPWWVVSLGAIAVGIIGAKVWYIIVYSGIQGWCIQGFVTAATVSAIILLLLLRIPVGSFLDMITPGLLIAMAIGRVGCFFAGCCGGSLTASRWGVWSSDQRVGGRRVPTQLLELSLALILGLAALVAILSHGPASGAFFALSIAAYTLVRQGILRLRAEPRKSRITGPIFASLATLVLISSIVFLVRQP